VLVIGGGPAGLAAAIAAREKGFEVTVADGAKPPVDKACGEGLMPNTLEVLGELGVAICPDDGQVFRGIRFVNEVSSAEANFFGIGGVGLRRTVLHQKMVERAQGCGITLLWNSPVAGLADGGVIVGGKTMSAKWIIGADGIHSRVRRWCGLEAGAQEEIRFAQRRHYRVKAWADCIEVHWGKKMQVCVTPLGKGETCVALISRDPRMRLEDAWREFPKLAANLGTANPSSAERGAVTVTRRLEHVYKGNIALIGDASGSVDAITGEGLCLSFQQAIALANALEMGQLGKYERAHRRLARRPNIMGRLLLLLDRYPPLRRCVLRALAGDPAMFARLLTVHRGKGSPKVLAAIGIRLGWQFLTA
jgi:2-polyprenyl-6-methoxyphenol hydroxylase-like FAD-dependent oxidoreductase